MSFNKAQSMAIAHKDGPLMVLAGPGSGKTLVITNRIEYLIKYHKVKPEEILVITFTKVATKEMKERFLKLSSGKSLPVTFGTFHGVYYGILKWAYHLNASNILTEDEKFRLLKEVMSHIEMEIDDEKEFLQGVASEISNIKNNQIKIGEYESLNCTNEIFNEIFITYEKRRKSLKKIDFDDMLVLCYELFHSRNDILSKWQHKFKYILIDEFQDINKVQYDVIRMLAAPENNLFVVGDDDQSIYQFRGAKPELMLGFKKDYPNAKEILLNVNYRSTKAIVNGAGRVIAKNTARFEKEIITLNEQGTDIHIQEVKDPIEESKYIVGRIEELKKQEIPSSEIAILFRTNTEPRTLVETLMEYNIPFQTKEYLPNLYEHFIGENIKTYLRMALGGRARKDFLDIMNRPNRYIGRDSLEKKEPSFEELRIFYCDKDWMQDRIDQWELDLRIMKVMAPYAAIQYLRKHIGYDNYLKEYALFRKINPEELYEVLEEIQNRAKAYKTIEEWFAHIEAYTIELKKQAHKQDNNLDAITLLTMHGAKGLEFDCVFIIATNEDIIPYKKAKLPEEIEEERRMFYVAMTRAKQNLTISYTKVRNGKDLSPSRFVNELLLIV
ncbi:MAG: ATP-dependent helicase [Lachnospiraceae bacterium]|nr:ATP-dependent helicase [Lachnospiraceae bacterium]